LLPRPGHFFISSFSPPCSAAEKVKLAERNAIAAHNKSKNAAAAANVKENSA
jgi:hypothetical protein